ncbi:MAG: hypothetical protein HQL52_16785 [Magnetococcales bacterium]|nr:hypothetical protein [Magnetococcales bacterium]
MKILATLKPERYEVGYHAYGVLAEIDWFQRRVIRTLKIPCASFRDDQAFMGPLIGGVCQVGNRIYVAFWNFIIEVDYDRFEIINTISTPQMADLHGMTTDGKHLWVASTAVESVLCLDIQSGKPLWRWGPDDPLLSQDPPPLMDRLRDRMKRGGGLKVPDLDKGEYRYVHKSRSPFYRHHLNEVTWHKGSLYVGTKGWFGEPYSAIIHLNPKTRAASFMVEPGGFMGAHDGVFHEGRFVVTESSKNGVAWRNPNAEIIRQELHPARFFVRGLCFTGNSFLVGFTRVRKSKGPSWIIECDPRFNREFRRMELKGFYPPHQGTAIHALEMVRS